MRMTCPACGVSTIVPPDETTGVIRCASCGKRIRYGEPTPVRGEDDIDFEFSPGDAPTPPIPKLGRRKKTSSDWRKILLAGFVGAMSTAMVVVIWMVAQRVAAPESKNAETPPTTVTEPAWDVVHRSNLLQLQAQADGLAREGKWQQSYDTYQNILIVIGSHPVSDPVAVTVVQSVRPGEDRAMAALLAIKSPLDANPTQGTNAQSTSTTAPSPSMMFPPSIISPGASPPSSTIATTQASPLVVRSTTTQATAPPAAQLTPAEQAADTAPPLPGPARPPIALHAYTLPDAVTDAEIGQAINTGVKYLAGQFQDGHVMSLEGYERRLKPQKPTVQPLQQQKPHQKTDAPSDLDGGSDLAPIARPNQAPFAPLQLPQAASYGTAMSSAGVDALCVYALLNAGRAMDVPGLGQTDPFTQQILEALKQYKMDFTYHRSLRAAALSVFNRNEDNAALEDDLSWLERASFGGAYTYGMPGTDQNPGTWDNSNSQYGLLGVWAGAQAGKYVPQNYWLQVSSHWTGCAGENGTWGYGADSGAGSLTMTCAGIASMLVSRDYVDSDPRSVGFSDRASDSPLVDAGLRWLDTGDNCITGLAGGYALYGLERVGLASGFKYFGKHDWYLELAKSLVAQQHFNGSWGSDPTGMGSSATLIDTSYALLFLARGRHPILFNKLRYDGPWNNRPHDVAHLARFAAHELERPLNWQVVNLRRNWFDWMDSPVLYISGDNALNLTDQDFLSLQKFAEGGGTIFTHADGGNARFTKWVEQMVQKVFPKYELTLVPRGHELYSTVYPLKQPPPLLAVSNGSRLLLIHSPTDLAGGWQLDWTDEKKLSFQMGVNLFVYAAGKANLKNRLVSSYIPQDPNRPDNMLDMAVLQYPGEWSPEPYAWERFSRYFQWETHNGITRDTVELKALKPHQHPMAVLTGTVRHDFTDAENNAVRAYVQAGGVLLIDACGGQKAFIKSVETTLLPNAFPGCTPTPIASNHPLLLASRVDADDLTHPLLRSYANQNGGKDLPIETIRFGKGWVIFSRLDITTGLLGTQSWGILGFDPAYAQALAKNAVLWAEARAMGYQGSESARH